MKFILQPWQLMLIILASSVNRQQQEVIEYLRTENAVLKEKFAKKRILLTDDQRRRLAVKGKILGRKTLEQFETLFTADTIMRWHRQLVANGWDYSDRKENSGLNFGYSYSLLDWHFSRSPPEVFILPSSHRREVKVILVISRFRVRRCSNSIELDLGVHDADHAPRFIECVLKAVDRHDFVFERDIVSPIGALEEIGCDSCIIILVSTRRSAYRLL
ncbi:hypothetical protein Q31b_47770 [Novipirellula aureliae]|uniref:Uncharacterized protein n=1 Tax=Novipirellula aureliae TaxID=2527966 RepID=A0A5C6DNG4_9BACT|nr:hypothetical protein [Novipirellula aureliae]TWU36496.1 hypothetical protein Q31b_47770 [Novipirellula aureliae]